MAHVSTSYAERNTLNIRMHSRGMTRLTNGFSKKMENDAHAMALHFLYCNFIRIHKSLTQKSQAAPGHGVIHGVGRSQMGGERPHDDNAVDDDNAQIPVIARGRAEWVKSTLCCPSRSTL